MPNQTVVNNKLADSCESAIRMRIATTSALMHQYGCRRVHTGYNKAMQLSGLELERAT
jgi:hypothetical protein